MTVIHESFVGAFNVVMIGAAGTWGIGPELLD